MDLNPPSCHIDCIRANQSFGVPPRGRYLAICISSLIGILRAPSVEPRQWRGPVDPSLVLAHVPRAPALIRRELVATLQVASEPGRDKRLQQQIPPPACINPLVSKPGHTRKAKLLSQIILPWPVSTALYGLVDYD